MHVASSNGDPQSGVTNCFVNCQVLIRTWFPKVAQLSSMMQQQPMCA